MKRDLGEIHERKRGQSCQSIASSGDWPKNPRHASKTAQPACTANIWKSKGISRNSKRISNATISRRIAFQTFSLRSRLTISARPAGSRIKPDHLYSQFQARAEGKFLNADWVTFLKWPTRRALGGFFATPRDGQTSLLGLGAFLSFPRNL
jgi:hypothetical protein